MNEKLKFRLPTAEDAAEYISYRQAFLDAGSSMDGTGPMRRTPDPMEWLAINAQYADPATVPEGKVQSTQFVCERVSDGRIVGMLQVRLALNDYLLHYGGHIGYSVRPDERRRGYASWVLAQGLDYCRSMGLRKVLITCLDTNEASRRTILHAGGAFRRHGFELGAQRFRQELDHGIILVHLGYHLHTPTVFRAAEQ